jgi:hypothetical protein
MRPDPFGDNGSGLFGFLLGLLLLALVIFIVGALVVLTAGYVIATVCYVGGGCAGAG